MSNKKLTILLSLLLLTIVAITFGVTYAYLSVNAKQTEENVVETACFSTNFTEDNIINMTSYPMSSTKAFSLTPYTFTVTNNCSNTTNYEVYLNVLNDTSIALLDYINYSLDGSTVHKLSSLTASTLPNGVSSDNISTSYVIDTGSITSSKSFTLYLWIDESAGNDIMGSTFKANVTVYNTQG